MKHSDRRTFLKMIGTGAMAAGLPASITRALAIPAAHRTGTLQDVAHIVILMQENRSFDHYFGSLRGVRGFADPRAIRLPSGEPVWFQPHGTGRLLPFRPDFDVVGNHYLPDPPHDWNSTHVAWNKGRFDQWVAQKGTSALSYHTRPDAPFHYALADAFTICDAYHCSVLGPTDPNRYHMWTGWVGNDGANGGPVITNAELGYDWSTFPERLVQAGISWKVYQDAGIGLNALPGYWGWTQDPFIGNYGDNSLLYFHQYQNAPDDSPLAQGARMGTSILNQDRNLARLFDVLRDDVQSGRLPQVSWIVAPEALSEHPNWPANFGAWYTSQVLDILTVAPEVWSKTVLLVVYDEEGGFFDHMVPPTPPTSASEGQSTVPTTNELYAGDNNFLAGPYGLGMRVPLIAVSPWSRGGWVNSQLFDHTSLIQFIEARFGAEHPELIETNITPWRRAVTGDLTSVFDFRNPNTRTQPALPDTNIYLPIALERFPDENPAVPAQQTMPQQEPGIRPARALPYALEASGAWQSDGSFRIEFQNTGEVAAVFQVRTVGATALPRTYTVEPGKSLSDLWPIDGERYDLAVHGPNGFFRGFQGGTSNGSASLMVRAEAEGNSHVLALTLASQSPRRMIVRVEDVYTGEKRRLALHHGEAVDLEWSAARMQGWYDLVMTVEGDGAFRHQLAGHLESGQATISDPALGASRGQN